MLGGLGVCKKIESLRNTKGCCSKTRGRKGVQKMESLGWKSGVVAAKQRVEKVVLGRENERVDRATVRLRLAVRRTCTSGRKES